VKGFTRLRCICVGGGLWLNSVEIVEGTIGPTRMQGCVCITAYDYELRVFFFFFFFECSCPYKKKMRVSN
jgi:hypothetical protein